MEVKICGIVTQEHLSSAGQRVLGLSSPEDWIIYRGVAYIPRGSAYIASFGGELRWVDMSPDIINENYIDWMLGSYLLQTSTGVVERGNTLTAEANLKGFAI